MIKKINFYFPIETITLCAIIIVNNNNSINIIIIIKYFIYLQKLITEFTSVLSKT